MLEDSVRELAFAGAASRLHKERWIHRTHRGLLSAATCSHRSHHLSLNACIDELVGVLLGPYSVHVGLSVVDLFVANFLNSDQELLLADGC